MRKTAKASAKPTGRPGPDVVGVLVRFPKDVHAGMAALADESGESFNTEVRQACREYLERKGRRGR